jgi:MFS family permease
MSPGMSRRLFVVASMIVVQDLAFFAAISPLLPTYVDDLGLSETQAGVLTAAYPAGTLLAGLPGGFMAARLGPRTTVIIGLALMGVSSTVFGFAERIELLDASRFMQGVAGALTWSGAFTWVLESEARERRGATIGKLFGIAVAGALLGPPLGALAEAVGTEIVFGMVMVVSAALIAVASRLPDAGVASRDSVRGVLRAIATRPIVVAGALLTIPSIEFGATGVLVPLRIDELGGSAAVIALGFTLGAALEASFAPISGRLADRRSWREPYLAGLALTAVPIAAIAIVSTLPLTVAAVVVASIGAGVCFTPATKRISDQTEATGLHQGMAAGVTNIAWAGGEVLGAGAGGAVADAVGLQTAFAIVAVFLAIGIAAAARVPRGV